LTGPMFAILVFSAGGYRGPGPMTRGTVWVAMLAGFALSAYISIRDGQALLSILRHNWQRLTIILAGAICALVVLLQYFPGDVWSDYFYLGNGEFANYAQLAALLTGHWTPTADLPTPPYLVNHTGLRYGQDIVCAATALLSDRHPLNVVIPLSLLYRFQHAVAVGLIVSTLVDARRRAWLLLAILLVDSFLLLETFSFTSSFMSSNCAAPLFIAYLAMLASDAEVRSFRLVMLAVMANCFFLITYPEFLIVVKAFELSQLAVWFIRRQSERWKPILAVNLLTLILHPLLVVQSAVRAYQQVSGSGGWNIFSDPRESPLMYLCNLLGLHYAHVPDDPFASWQWLVLTLAVIAMGLVITGLGVLIFKYRLYLAGAFWICLAIFFHLMPVVQDGSHFYGAVKFMTQTTFVALAAVAAICQVRWRYARLGACACLVCFGAGAAFATVTTYAKVPQYTRVYDFPSIRKHVAQCRHDGQKIACLVQIPDLLIWNFAANEQGVPFVLLSVEQYNQLERWPEDSRLPTPIPPEAFDGVLVADTAIFRERTYSCTGILLNQAVEGQPFTLLAEGRPLRFRPQQALGRVGCAGLYRGSLSEAAGAEFPRHTWVTADSHLKATLRVTSTKLVVRGEVLGSVGLVMRYHFTLHEQSSGWHHEVVVPHPGSFEAAISLPDDFRDRLMTFDFLVSQTFRPCDLEPRSDDARSLGFIISSVAVVP
jgi:hypothetical protein